MKVFIIMTFLLLIMYGLGFIKSNNIKMEWMDRRYTTVLKGFSILTVIWAHGGAELGIKGIQIIAGIGVAIFLFCSGYGLEISYQKNELKRFWIKRGLKIVIPILLVELIWELLRNSFTWENYGRQLAKLDIGGWYIRYILICYIIFYVYKIIISCLHFNKSREMFVIFSVFLIFFIVECIIPEQQDISFLRARQMFSFPLGILVGQNLEIVNSKISNNYKCNLCAIGLIIIGILFGLFTQISVIANGTYWIINFLYLIVILSIMIGFLILTKNIKWITQNYFLLMVGELSYELFLAQSYALVFINDSVRSILFYLVNSLIMASFIFNITYILSTVLRLFRRRNER